MGNEKPLPAFDPDEDTKTYVRIRGARGNHEFINVYIAKSGRTLVDYREARTLRIRTVPADDVRRFCERCNGKVAALRKPKNNCKDCEELKF